MRDSRRERRVPGTPGIARIRAESARRNRSAAAVRTQGAPACGVKAYDSDALDDQLAAQGTDLIAPHRSNRSAEHQTQDGRYLRRYKRRWTVQRSTLWFQKLRRLCIRWEKSTTLFQGFLHLSGSILLLQEVLGWDLDNADGLVRASSASFLIVG